MKNALKAGTRQSIPIRELTPHPLAQRKFDPAHAARIEREFDPALFGTPTVAETKKGTKWIVDGQHRVKGALGWLNGDANQCVECLVIPVEDDAEAAWLFLGLNDHKAVTALNKFVVRIVGKDETAIGITAVLERFGLKVDYQRSDGVVQAVEACESLFSRDRGALLLERTIRVLHSTWGAEADAYHGQLIRGLGLLLNKHGTAVDDAELVRKLAKRSGPLGLLGRARDLKSAMGVSVAQAVYECIRNEYNKGRRTERIEDRAA
jgi:uncharacterized protein DUF6551